MNILLKAGKFAGFFISLSSRSYYTNIIRNLYKRLLLLRNKRKEKFERNYSVNQYIRSMNPKVDAVIIKAKKWQAEYKKLRTIVLDCHLTEELKWGVPCYTHLGKNIVLIHGFKDYCALLFMKGSLLKDNRGILIRQTDNVQAGRQIRFTDVREIVKMESTLKAYIREAVEVEKAGLKVNYKEVTEYKIPKEFQDRLNKTPSLKKSFNALTPGRQRAYLLYFSAPKQSKTRESRIEKYVPKILKGKGLHDM